MMNYTTTTEHNPAPRSRIGNQHSYFHSLTCQCPGLLPGGKGCTGWEPSLHSQHQHRAGKEQQLPTACAGVLSGFLVFEFWLLGGVLLLFGLLFFLNTQTRINFTKKLAISIDFLTLIPIQDTSVSVTHALSNAYSKNHYFTNSRKP